MRLGLVRRGRWTVVGRTDDEQLHVFEDGVRLYEVRWREEE